MIKAKALFGNHTDRLNELLEDLFAKEDISRIHAVEAKLIADRNNHPQMLLVIFYEVMEGSK